jgi:hypothetical protein
LSLERLEERCIRTRLLRCKPGDITTDSFLTHQQAERFCDVCRLAGARLADGIGVTITPEVLRGPYQRQGRWYVDLAWR